MGHLVACKIFGTAWCLHLPGIVPRSLTSHVQVVEEVEEERCFDNPSGTCAINSQTEEHCHATPTSTYKNPRLRIMISVALVLVFTWSVQMSGTGMIASTTSVMMFVTAYLACSRQT
jgi:hypothetical protein